MSVVVAACVLAAGAGRRMGAAKAGLALDGRTFLECLLESFRTAGCAPLFVVAATDDPEMRAACDRSDAQLLVNPTPERGMLSSLHVCLGSLVAAPAGVDALFVAPVDCPRVGSATIAALAAAFATTRAPVVVPTYGSRRGHPTLFAAAVFTELLRAPLDAGARAVVRAHAADRVELAVDDPAVLDDIDTPDALQALREGKPSGTE